MSITSVARMSLALVSLLALTGCPPQPPPPVINDFVVAPTNQCATASVGVRWGASADRGRITSSPPVPSLPYAPSNLNDGGFRFLTATTDTTYTFTVERGGLEEHQSVRVTIVPDPSAMTLELPYNCTLRVWEHPALSRLVYGDEILAHSFTNMEFQPLTVDFGGRHTDLFSRVPTGIGDPVPLTSDRWTAHPINGIGPECISGSNTAPGSPPPVHITITTKCR